jgi:hypothetical protein
MEELGISVGHVLEEIWMGLVIVAIFFLGWHYHFLNDIFAFLGTVLLGLITWKLWLHYIQQDFISGIEFVVLEIIPPRDVLRSPKAMELFITNALYHWSQKGGKEEFWQGAVWLWFSLELVSIEGQVHFYIRTPSRIRSLIETQMYAQYPQAQVKVVEDYALGVDEITPKSKWMGWGCEFKLLKAEAFPLKTYVDFGLDKDPKEELKIDPISPVVEFFGSLGKGEQAWVQIVVRPSKKEYHTKGTWFGYHDWVQESQKAMIKMLAPYSSHKDAKTLDEIGIGRSRIEIRVPPFFDRAMKAMNAKTSKIGFDTGIRVMYVATKDVYTINRRKDIRLIFRQYAMPDVNGLVRHNSTQGDAYSGIFPASSKTVMMLANRMLHEYQERAFFHLPLRHNLFNVHTVPWPMSGFVKAYFHPVTYVLNTEELATIWHFPGQILKVPTLERIESKEASPPTNLPI